MKNCGHTYNCGCKDSYLTTPPPCPTPVDCPDPQPCSEVFDAQCVLYTGTDILCDTDVVVTQNTSVAQAIEDIVTYFCAAGANLFLLNPLQCPEDPLGTIAQAGTPVNQAIEDVVAYFCNAIANIPTPNLWLNITADTGTTTADTPTDTLNIVGGNDITTSIVGDTVTIDYTGSGGLLPWQIVTASLVGGPYETTLIPNSRIIYQVGGGATYAEFTLPDNQPIGTEIEVLFRGQQNFYIKPTPSPSNTFVQVWRASGYLSAASSSSQRLEWSTASAGTYNTHFKLLSVSNSGGVLIWVVIEQSWNDQLISVV